MYEHIKLLWQQGEFNRAYSITKDNKLNDLINMINKQGGIEHIPPSVVMSIVLENEYLSNFLWQMPQE